MMFGRREQMSLPELTAQALDGDMDACVLLARRSTGCESFTEWLDRYVPEPEIGRVFDVFADAYYKVRQERAMADLPTLEVPAVDSNLNVGYA